MGIKLIDKINAEQTAILKERNYPDFRAGDVGRVSIKIKEGDKFRIQDFEGKVLAVDNGRGNVAGQSVYAGRRVEFVPAQSALRADSQWRKRLAVQRDGRGRHVSVVPSNVVFAVVYAWRDSV